ncbi:hypothetical protein [Actinomadura fibrosa]|uniref:WXG100 family type VII secretion target n=1 Tax=Actinomadura fibrosa TaxID=111802 RepID=A0ABW2XQD8_9ACTN|nr:hypothetical protein [Actinomadura fibrosa]
MAPELKVDHQQMLKTGRSLGEAAQGVKAHWEQFQAELESFGQPWGQDDVGSLIGGCYQAIFEYFQECLGENADAVGEHAAGVQEMAHGYREAEDTSHLEVNRVRDVL